MAKCPSFTVLKQRARGTSKVFLIYIHCFSLSSEGTQLRVASPKSSPWLCWTLRSRNLPRFFPKRYPGAGKHAVARANPCQCEEGQSTGEGSEEENQEWGSCIDHHDRRKVLPVLRKLSRNPGLSTSPKYQRSISYTGTSDVFFPRPYSCGSLREASPSLFHLCCGHEKNNKCLWETPVRERRELEKRARYCFQSGHWPTLHFSTS